MVCDLAANWADHSDNQMADPMDVTKVEHLADLSVLRLVDPTGDCSVAPRVYWRVDGLADPMVAMTEPRSVDRLVDPRAVHLVC